MSKNPYATNPKYLLDPFDSLYQIDAVSDSDHIQDLIDEAAQLESQIAGDFDLDELTDKIKINALGYVKNGLLSFKIKSLKLYVGTYRTFKQFCKSALGLSTWQVNRQIRAARAVMELVAHGFSILPQCEAQCRALLGSCEENLIGAWQSVIDNLSPHEITAKSITKHLSPPETEPTMPKSEKITVNQNLFKRMFTVALSVGSTIEQLLEQIFQPKQNCANFYYQEKVEQWQNDLENLVKNYYG